MKMSCVHIDNCDLKGLSECCNARIGSSDICMDCGEHCEDTCTDCEFFNDGEDIEKE